MGQFSPHPHFSAFGAAVALGVTCSWVCSSIFVGGFGVVIVVRVGGIGQSFLNLKIFPDIFPALGHGCQCELGYFQVVGGCSLKYLLVKGFDFLNLLEHWELLQVVVLLVLDSGLATTFTLYFFVRISFFLFSVALVSFLICGLVSGWAGLD